jgi:hypothetical protein
LGTLALSATTFTVGTPSSGTITGATVGSAITASGLPTGLTINGVARTWAWDGTGTAGSGSFTLTETLLGAVGSPKTTTINYVIGAAGGSFGGLGTLSAATLGFPSPIATNPTTIQVTIPPDWQSGDVLKLAYSSSESISPFTVLSHTLTDADVAGGTITLGIPTLAGATFFQALGSHSGVDSANLSNKVKWGDTTAPTITSASAANQTELIPLSFALTAGETVTWAITGGADQTRFTISGSTLEWFGNGVQDFGVPLDSDANNTYVVQVTATDLSGNTTSQTITITVTAADRTPDAFTFTNVIPSTPSTTYTSNTITISGLTPGIAAPSSVTAGLYSKNGGSFVSAGSFTVSNGDTLTLKDTSGPGSNDVVNAVVTVGTYSTTWTVSNTVVTTVLPTTTGVDKSASVTTSGSPPLVFTGDSSRGTDDGARVSGSGITDKRAYEVTLNALPKQICMTWEYANPGYADLSGGGSTTIPGNGGTAQGTFYAIFPTGIFNPSSGTISNAPAVGDTYHLDIDPVAGTADLYRIRSGVVTTIHNLTGLPTGKTWRAVVFASGTGGSSDQGTCNFGQNTPARTPTTGYKMYGAP